MRCHTSWTLELHRAREHTAHRVGNQPHRLAARCARIERRLDCCCQATRFFFERPAPIERELDHLVRLRQKLGQVVVAHANWSVGLDAVGPAGVVELLQPVDQAPAEPDPLRLDLQIAAQNSRQQEHGRLFARRLAVIGSAPQSAHASGRFARPRQRPDHAEAGGHVLRQRIDDRFGSAVVAEVVEVRNLATLVEHEARTRCARCAAVHRARLHDQVVVGPVERVGHQRLQPRRDRVALDVAGDHAQLARNRFVDCMQPANQRTVGNLRREAWNQLYGVGAALRHFGQEFDERGRDRDAGQLECPLEHRQVGIEPLEASSVPRAGHPTRTMRST